MENSNKIGELNINNFLETARNYVKENDKVNAEHYINLALLASDLEFSLKIQTMGIRSFINFSISNLDIVLLVAIKFLKEIKKKTKISDLEICNCYVRGLYRIGSLLLNSNIDIFLSGFFFHKAKLFVEHNEIIQNNKELLNLIEFHFISALDEISKRLHLEKEKYLNHTNNESYYVISDYFGNEIKNSSRCIEDKIFIISSSWIRNLVSFINKKDNILDKKFERRNVCLLYFQDGLDKDKDENKKYLGSYPGPINNFNIISMKDLWQDPSEDENYTNTYLKNDVKENSDFIILNEQIYNTIKGCFKINSFEIERRLIKVNNEKMYEIHLKRIKILVVSHILCNRENKQLIRPRYIQISNTKTVKELKEKIIRCLAFSLFKCKTKNEENFENYWLKNEKIFINTQLKLYLPEFSSQNINNELFHIIHSYNNSFLQYTFQGEEIQNDDLLIVNLKIAVKDVLLVEIRTDNDPRKNWFLNIKADDEQFPLCFLCEERIKEKKVPCELCDQYIYCCEECRRLDKIHINYHQNIKKLYKKKFELDDILNISISELVPKSSRHGLTGLKNLGNTCFMNSAVQCLSNTEELTKYFLSKKYLEEINKNNKHGSGGQIAKAYYELLKEIWIGHSSYLSPWDFRQIFVGFVKQFAGFSQHDSHEMLAFVLDALHEDLNRIKDKPCFELKEKLKNENDEEASVRWWNSHLSRENSIIVDLFHGQHKSIITCPDCNKISITYDAFMYLGLPIPSGLCRAKIKFFPLITESSNKYIMKEFDISINEQTTLSDIKNKIKNEYSILKNVVNSQKNSDNNSNIFLEAIVTSSKEFKKRIAETSPVLYYYENYNEIIIYEVQYPVERKETYIFYALPMEFIEDKSFYGNKIKSVHPIFYVNPFTLMKGMTVKDLYMEIFIYYRKILPDLKNRTWEQFKNKLDDSEYIFEEFKKYFNSEGDRGGENIPFKLHIVNNLPESNYSTCEFCEKNCENYCSFNFSQSTPISVVKDKQKVRRPFLIYVEFLSISKKKRLFEDVDITQCTKNVFFQKDNVNIYDCLEAFRSEEKLEKENAWFCSVCKDHKEANKKLEIFRAPNILIIQLKRFKIKTNNVVLGLMHNKKNDSLVEFPIDDLDLRTFVVSQNSREELIYELVCISQHFGNLSSGHYTSICRNNGKWFHFDDEKVSISEEEDVVTPAAYLLFYRKKSLVKY